jgi:hypothetical protein
MRPRLLAEFLVVAPPVGGVSCVALGHWPVGAAMLIAWLLLMFYAMSEPV